MTKNEKVIQITANANGVFGLSSTGQLIIFDQEANSWVLKCPSDILSVNKANIIKMPTEELLAPTSRYRNPQVDIESKAESDIMLKAIIFTGLSLAMAGMVIYFLIN